LLLAATIQQLTIFYFVYYIVPYFILHILKETENNILDAEPLVGKGVGAALFLASKKGNKLVMF